MKKIEVFGCAYCSKIDADEDGMLRHEKICIKNPSEIERKRVVSADEIAITEIINTVVSIPEFIQRITEFLDTKGLILNLTDYPSTWSDKISNSHNSPKGYRTNWGGGGDKDGIPKNYPGWSGNWRGTITIKDGVEFKDSIDRIIRRVSLSDLSRNTNGLPNIWPIQTGTGSGGDSFSYDGMMFLYDFPKMHEEWKSNGGEVELLGHEYNKHLKSYKDGLENAQDSYIISQDEMQDITRYIKNIDGLQRKARKLSTLIDTIHRNDFNEAYDIFPKSISTAFVDIKMYIKSKEQLVIKLLPELDSGKDYITELLDVKEDLELIEKDIQRHIVNHAQELI